MGITDKSDLAGARDLRLLLLLPPTKDELHIQRIELTVYRAWL